MLGKRKANGNKLSGAWWPIGGLIDRAWAQVRVGRLSCWVQTRMLVWLG
jgi:hypothetical protein